MKSTILLSFLLISLAGSCHAMTAAIGDCSKAQNSCMENFFKNIRQNKTAHYPETELKNLCIAAGLVN